MVAERVVELRPRVGRQGRQPRLVEDLRDARDEVTALCAEALEFVAYARPVVSALVPACHELGPRHYQLVLGLLRRIDSLERRHTPDPNPAVEAVA